jgi:ABC-type branched-subunit amino acid transport system ATPase component
MTVLENLQMGASLDNLKYFKEDSEKVFTLFPRLKERSTSAAARFRAASSRCCRSRAR